MKSHSVTGTVGHLLTLLLCLYLSLPHLSTARIAGNAPYSRSTKITDFRYSSARIDGITKLYNGTLLVISNGHYWMLGKNELPHKFNVRGHISQLYSGMSDIDDVWIDPYNDDGEHAQLYLAQNSATRGLNVVCQEFDNPFSSDSGFCHLPVNGAWQTALKDLDSKKPIDAVTWRNRTRGQDGGFWVFFQGEKMITIDPYEMRLRRTYDMKKWMKISDQLTAAHYDYEHSVFHLFFNNNGYRTWRVNETMMNKLPMGWDRGFLHGELSPLMKLNRDFLGFSTQDTFEYTQPYFERFIAGEESKGSPFSPRQSSSERSPSRPIVTSSTTTTTTTSTTRKPLTSTESDVLYITPTYNNRNIPLSNKGRNQKNMPFRKENGEEEPVGNTLEKDESLSYQRQLMELDREGVKDFASDTSINALPKLQFSLLLIICTFFITTLFV